MIGIATARSSEHWAVRASSHVPTAHIDFPRWDTLDRGFGLPFGPFYHREVDLSPDGRYFVY